MSDTLEYDVFLSHSSKDLPAARELAERLKGDGLRVWLDEWVIQPGDSIPLAIEQGLESSRTLILVMSENAFASEWVTLERHTAIFRDPTNQQRRFIPLRLDDASVPDALRQFAYVDWRKGSVDEYVRLRRFCQAKDTPKLKEGTLPECVLNSGISLTRHGGIVRTIAIADNGLLGISGADDWTARIWSTKDGSIINSLHGHDAAISSVGMTSDGKKAVTASADCQVKIWDVESSTACVSFEHASRVLGVSVTPEGRRIVSTEETGDVNIWDVYFQRRVATLHGHTAAASCVDMTPDGSWAVTGSKDNTIRVWNLQKRTCVSVLRGHTGSVCGVELSDDGGIAASCSSDRTLKIWDIKQGKCISTFEGHTASVLSVALSNDTEFAVTASLDTTVRLWGLKSGECLARIEDDEPVGAVAIVGRQPRIAHVSHSEDVRACDIPKQIYTRFSTTAVSRYTNAKVLLVGDSGVGKSGLAIRLTENNFEPTVSSDAHWATQLKLPHDASTNKIDREIWLWDFAGQADYRLIHQLFMDETALAVLVFNPQSQSPFEGLSQWDRDLARAARRGFSKLLVAGRCDRGGLMVRREAVEEFARQRGFTIYLETSALTGNGCESLRDEIVARIDWDSIPWTASPRIFKLLKDEILRLRDEGVVLLRMGELKQQLEMRLVDETFSLGELRAVVGLLAGPGLVWKLEFGDVVMLQPEWINKYAAAVIRSVRAHFGEIGVINEAQVLAGDLNYTFDIARGEAHGDEEANELQMQRLDPCDEVIVLRAMHQMFVDHGLCVREELEGGNRQLIFPSYFKQELPSDPGHPPILVTYQFDGHAEEIYATLVVQLWQTKAFENGKLWKHAADFKSATGAPLGLKMVRHDSKKPEICVYFAPNAQDDTKVTFIKYVHEHLLQKAQDVVRLRAFVCPHCGHPVRDTELAREILTEDGANAEIRCQQRNCDRRFSLWDAIEQKFASEEFQQRVRDLEEKAKAVIDNESRELILEGHARVITGEAGQIYRGYTGSDHGIDGEIEFKDDLGQASGKRLYLQLKSGDSYLYKRKSDGVEVFQIKKQRWAGYWREQAYPVMLVIRTSDEQIRWMNVTEYLEEVGEGQKTPVKQIEFDGEPFTAINVHRMRNRLIPPSSAT